MATTKVKLNQLELSITPGSLLTSNASNIPSYIAPSTGTNHLAYYKDSVTGWVNLAVGTNLSIDTGTNTLNASAGAGGYATIQEEGSTVGSGNTTINFIGSGITAANAGGGVTSITLDATLNALSSYNTNGFLVQTSADTFTGRSLVAPAAGFTITNNDAVSGNPTFALANDLAALEALSSTGIAVRTGSETWAQRTITGTANRITVTNGDGVSGNPTLDVGSDVAILSENETVSGSWAFSNNVVLNGTPSLDTHAVTKGYVDGLLNGLSWKDSVDVATTANITLSGEQTIDGVTTSSSRVLVKNQSTASQNGIYISGAGAWTRATDMDAWSEVPAAAMFVEAGTTQADTAWVCTSNDGGTLGSTAITFVKFSSASGVIDGSGAANKVAYWSDTDTLTSTTNFHFNGTQLAVGTDTPQANTATTIRGTSTGSGTSSLVLEDSTGTNLFNFKDNGELLFNTTHYINPGQIVASGTSGWDVVVGNTSSGAFSVSAAGGSTFNSTNASITTPVVTIQGLTKTSSGSNLLNLTVSYAPTTGSTSHAGLHILQSINQSGSASGITRGVYINPTLTNAVDFRGVEINANSSHYALYTTSGKVRFDLGSDASWDLLARSATGELARVANGTTGQVLTATTGSAPTWQSVSAGTFTVGYVTGTGTDTYDLDAGTVVKDVDGAGFAFTVPADLNKVIIYRNGVLLSRSGSVSRDYTLNSGTGVLVLASSLATDETLTIYKIV